jgi:PAS domain S-box-containing protein
MAITSPAKGILEVNDELCAILGYERSELIHMTWAEMTHPGDLAADATQFSRVEAGEIDGYSLDKRWIRKDGRVIDSTISVKCQRRADGTVEYFVALLQDITERKRAEEALRRSHDELELRVAERTQQLTAVNEELRKKIAERTQAEQARQQLLQQLVGAQEEERRRISHELHDSLGQHLTALHIGLKSAHDQDGCPPQVADGIDKLRELALTIDAEVDRLSFELRPPALDNLGLQAALRLLVKEWSATSHIPVDQHIGQLDQQRLPATVETTIYRIVQEALTNILKHAGAARVSLIVRRQDGEVLAIVEDNGSGFDVEAGTSVPGTGRQLGIAGMRERAALVGGWLDIETIPGSGTTVFVHIPLPPEEGGGKSAADD